MIFWKDNSSIDFEKQDVLSLTRRSRATCPGGAFPVVISTSPLLRPFPCAVTQSLCVGRTGSTMKMSGRVSFLGALHTANVPLANQQWYVTLFTTCSPPKQPVKRLLFKSTIPPQRLLTLFPGFITMPPQVTNRF